MHVACIPRCLYMSIMAAASVEECETVDVFGQRIHKTPEFSSVTPTWTSAFDARFKRGANENYEGKLAALDAGLTLGAGILEGKLAALDAGLRRGEDTYAHAPRRRCAFGGPR